MTTQTGTTPSATTNRTMTLDGGFTEETHSQTCSVEISRNAKGQIQYGVKLYFALDDAAIAERVKALTDQLDTLYEGRLAG